MEGPGGVLGSGVQRLSVAYNSNSRGYLTVWDGSTATGLLEIYGRSIDPQGVPLGADAFRISDHSQGNPSFAALHPDVVFNPDRDEFLVVWAGRDFFLGANGYEILGQRLTADGTPQGGLIRISDMGDESNQYHAFGAKVVYSEVDQEYLVIWYGTDNEGGVDTGYEIFGQRLDTFATEIGSDFRISQMGTEGDSLAAAFEPALAFDPLNRWYLVVWHGDPATGSLENDEFEIFGQLLDAQGTQIGSDDFMISQMASIGDADFDAQWPAVAFDTDSRRWLVVWYGDEDQDGHVDDETEIYGQLLNESGNAIGEDDFQISSTGPIGDPSYQAFQPDVAFDPILSRFLVTWFGNPLAEFEVYAAPVSFDAQGEATIPRGLRISDMGPDGDPLYLGTLPVLAQDSVDGRFLVTFAGSDDEGGHGSAEYDAFGQLLSFPFFLDGFESGDTNGWSQTAP